MKPGTLLVGRASARHSSRQRWQVGGAALVAGPRQQGCCRGAYRDVLTAFPLREPARRPRESASFVGLKPDLRKVLPLLCLALTACSSPPPESRSFSCKGGTTFEVAGGGKSVTLTRDGKDHQLPRVHSGSGKKYTDRRLLFWDKGDGHAILASSTHGLVHCQAQ